MNEYERIWDSSDDLENVNLMAREGWRVIATFNDERRGQMFIMERTLAPLYAIEEKLTVVGETKSSSLPADYWETAQ